MTALLGDSRSVAALVLVLTLALLLTFHWRDALPGHVRRAMDALLGGTVVLGAAGIARAVYQVAAAPPIWDFHVFWTYGRVAVARQDFYDPRHIITCSMRRHTPLTFCARCSTSDSSIRRHPFGCLRPSGGSAFGPQPSVWMTLQVACLLASIVALWRLFLPRTGAAGLALAAALMLMLGATTYTVYKTQTNFLLLLLLLMFWRSRDTVSGGVWLAAGTLVKPVVGVLALYPLVRRRWRSLAACVAAGAVACGVTAVVFGWPTVRSYFVANPAGRMPRWTFVELTNQSLLAAVLRTLPSHAAAAHLARDPVYLLLTAVVIGVTAWCAARLPGDEGHDELALATLVPTALLVYPGTLTHYSVILLAPLLWLWGRRGTQTATVVAVAALIAIAVALTGLHAGARAIVATLLVWCVLLAVSVRALRRGAALQPAPVPSA